MRKVHSGVQAASNEAVLRELLAIVKGQRVALPLVRALLDAGAVCQSAPPLLAAGVAFAPGLLAAQVTEQIAALGPSYLLLAHPYF